MPTATAFPTTDPHAQAYAEAYRQAYESSYRRALFWGMSPADAHEYAVRFGQRAGACAHAHAQAKQKRMMR